MSFADKIRTAALDFLRIVPAKDQRITLRESIGFASTVIRNKVWYRGDPSELSQLAKALKNTNDDTLSTRFWAQVPEVGQIRKAHSGIPAVIVDTLAYIVKSDLDKIDVGEDTDRWADIAKENDFPAIVGQAVVDTLVTGDGAFKISTDSKVSQYPILEFWPADRVEYEIKRGRIVETRFLSWFVTDNGKAYKLVERFSRDGILYEVYDEDGAPAEMSDVPEIAEQGLVNVEFSKPMEMAIPFSVYRSSKYPGRGRSIFDNKIDAFDAHDEVISQWTDAIRAGRVIRYIPQNLVPRNPENGTMTSASYFEQNFLITDADMRETAQSRIDMQQAEINYEAFVASYAATLNQCLQGIISPATLGIDVGKMSSADAQREKKDVTGYTRNAITDALEKVLPRVVVAMLHADDVMSGAGYNEYELPDVSFGEYGAPDFDSRIQSVGNAAAASIMSIQTQIDELWGSSKDDEWKEAEARRIMKERGIEVVDEPSTGDDV